MIEHKGKYYYSCSEIAKMFNCNHTITEGLKKKFCNLYNKNIDTFITDSYIQSKLHPAAKKKLLKYLKYKKENGERIYLVFNLQDVIEFLDNPIAINIQQKKYTIIEEV